MKKIILFFPLVILLVFTSACNSQNSNTTSVDQPNDVLEKVAGENVYKNVDAGLFKQLTSKGDVVVIDVRTPGEYAQGHLENSTLINFMDKNFEAQIAQLDKGATTLVYCHSGRRSAGAMKKMKSAGFTEVYNLTGGIGAWTAAGGKMVK